MALLIRTVLNVFDGRILAVAIAASTVTIAARIIQQERVFPDRSRERFRMFSNTGEIFRFIETARVLNVKPS